MSDRDSTSGRQEALEQDIIECCREMADVYLEIQREFEPLDAEVDRAYAFMQEAE